MKVQFQLGLSLAKLSPSLFFTFNPFIPVGRGMFPQALLYIAWIGSKK